MNGRTGLYSLIFYGTRFACDCAAFGVLFLTVINGSSTDTLLRAVHAYILIRMTSQALSWALWDN